MAFVTPSQSGHFLKESDYPYAAGQNNYHSDSAEVAIAFVSDNDSTLGDKSVFTAAVDNEWFWQAF
jgi:hypothetical protein